MPDSSTCKRTPCCCCIAATVVVVAIFAISAPLAAQLLSGETPIPPGETGPIDLHKSLVDKMSLLSFSQETSGSEGSTTPAWILVIILCGASMVFALAYLYHQKVRLPRRRSTREEERVERERNARNMAFLERLMRDEGNPPPA